MLFLSLMFAAAALVVPALLYVAIRYPGVVMIAAFVMTPFQTALFGETAEVRMGVVDVLAIAMCLPLAVRLLMRGSLLVGGVGLVVTGFLATATLSSVLAGLTADAGVSLARMLTNTLLPVLLYANLDRRMLTYHRCYLGYLLSVNVLSLAVIGAFARGGIQGSMYALGMSKNFTGPVLGCGIGVAVVYLVTEGIRGRRGIWLLGTLGLASVALILTLSRGAWIATAVGTLIAVCTTRNVRLVIIGGIVGLIGCAATWKLLPDTATEYASNVSSKASSINLRLQYIDYVMARFRSNPVFGVGVGLRKVMEPHNVIVLTAGESGVVGVAAFVGMFVAGLWTTISAWRRAKHLIAARQLAAMATVVFSIALIDGMMDVYWRRGIGFMGWAGVGIAVLVGRSIPRAAAPVRRPLIGRDVPVAV